MLFDLNKIWIELRKLGLAKLDKDTSTQTADTPLDADLFSFWDVVDGIRKKITATNLWVNYFKGKADETYEPKKGSDDNYVTDAQLIVIGNTSGTNTGDQVCDLDTLDGVGSVGDPFKVSDDVMNLIYAGL